MSFIAKALPLILGGAAIASGIGAFAAPEIAEGAGLAAAGPGFSTAVDPTILSVGGQSFPVGTAFSAGGDTAALLGGGAAGAASLGEAASGSGGGTDPNTGFPSNFANTASGSENLVNPATGFSDIAPLVTPQAAGSLGTGVDASTGQFAGETANATAGAPSGFGDTLSQLWDKYKALTKSPVGTAFNIGTGLYNLYQGRQLQQLAQRTSQQQDPFQSQRAQYQAQLNALVSNPSSITGLPGYAAGLEAVNRSQAAGGYLGSGNQILADATYGSNLYNQTVQQLGQLAGANFAPGGAGNTTLATNTAGLQLAGNSLNRIGYGLSG